MSQDIPDPRASGARGSRARLALSMGVVGSLVLGGCASIPTSGPVHVAEPPTSSTTESADAPGRMASATQAMVLAVNWPPQEPSPGQATSSSARSDAMGHWPAACAPTASSA